VTEHAAAITKPDDVIVEEAHSSFPSRRFSRKLSADRDGAKKFRHKVKHAQLLLISGAKVAEENKIGEPPQGWFRELALALQAGIASEHGSSSSAPAGFQAPFIG